MIMFALGVNEGDFSIFYLAHSIGLASLPLRLVAMQNLTIIDKSMVVLCSQDNRVHELAFY